MKKAMRDQLRALIGALRAPSTGVLGSVLLANGTAAATEPPPRVSTAHPVPSIAPAAVSRRALPEPRTLPARSSGTCFDQHELGQELRQSGKLLESHALFRSCASEHCPAAVQRDCRAWSAELDTEVPSVTLRVSVAGQPRSDARVEIDGKLRSEAPAQAVKLDPGLHDLHVSAPEARPLHRRLELRPGAREQLSLSLTPLPERTPKPVSVLSWVLGGVGLAGTAGFVAFGLSSRSLEHELEERCSPLCSEEQIDRVKQRSVLANVSLGLGVSSLAAAGALYLLQTSDKPEEPGLRVGLAPLRGRGHGAVCNVQLRTF